MSLSDIYIYWINAFSLNSKVALPFASQYSYVLKPNVNVYLPKKIVLYIFCILSNIFVKIILNRWMAFLSWPVTLCCKINQSYSIKLSINNIYLITNHYLFKKYLLFIHFSTAINNCLANAYNRVSKSFMTEYTGTTVCSVL